MNETPLQFSIDNVRPNVIDLRALYGINIVQGTIAHHGGFKNPKLTLREPLIAEITAGLVDTGNTSFMPPIDIYKSEDGSIVHLDGDHRTLATLRAYMKTGNESFLKLRANRLMFKNDNEAREYQFRMALDDSRSSLNEAEQLEMVRELTARGLTPGEIANKLGKKTPNSNSRWANRIVDILNATPAVAAAVESGHLDLTTAGGIARKVAPAEQKKVVEKAVEKKKSGVKAKDIRQQENLRKPRTESRAIAEIDTYLFEDIAYHPAFQGDRDSGKVNAIDQGRFEAIVFVLGFDEIPESKMFEVLNDRYNAYMKKRQDEEDKEARLARKAQSQNKEAVLA